MATWQTVRVGQMGRVVTGKTPPSERPDEFGNIYPFITPSDIPYTKKHIEVERYLSERGMESHRRIQLPKKSVCVVCIGATVGKTCMTSEPSISNQQINSIIPTYGEFDSDFVYYISTTLKDSLLAFAGGAATPIINKSTFSSIKLLIPQFEEQQKIAAVMAAYDDLIEKNQRRIALLEKMAEEIYREWFVRLRFPGHENVKVTKGIPEGWSIDRVDTIGKVVTGKTPSTEVSRYFNGEFHFIKTPDMHGNLFIYDTEETLTNDGINSQKAQTIPASSICVSCIGTGGIVSITTRTCQTNQQINTVVLHEKDQLEWAFFTIRNLKEMIQIFGSTGTTMTNLSKGKFSSLKLIKPDHGIIKRFHSQVQPMFEQIASLMQQTKALKKSRDILLPRLISGKLNVEHLDIQFPPSMLDEAEPSNYASEAH